MKIVICGIGETGYYIAKILLREGHDLVLVEQAEKAVRYAQERLDAQIVQGDASNPLVLEPLIDDTTDLFMPLTDNDKTNIISTLIARNYGAKRVIARVSEATNLIHPLLTDDPSVSVLNAEMAVSKDLSRLVGNPSADEIEFFAHGKAEMMKLSVEENAKITGQPLKEVKVPSAWILVARMRNGDFEIVTGDTVLNSGDHVLAIGDPKKSKQIEDVLGLQPAVVRRVIIVGYNDISVKLARTLSKRGIEVRLIEEDKELAEKASAELDKVLVFQGDSTGAEVMDQAGVDQTDYLLALTGDDEANVLISLLAKEKKVKRVIALTQKPQYKPIIEKIGIDSVINPRSAMADEIIHCLHNRDVSGINIIEDGKGRMLEFVVQKKTKYVDKPLSKIKLPKQTLIGAIVREDHLIIPRGDEKIKLGDHLVVFTTHTVLTEVKKLFS